jgi:ParB/RepB/Spo0J family partition protein
MSVNKITDISAVDVTDKDVDTGTDMIPDNGDQLLYLLPEDINIPDELDVRPWSNRVGPSEKETEALTNLVTSIEAEGQIQPIKVRYNADGGYDLVAGRRRHMAVSMINAAKNSKESPLRLKAVVTKESETNAKKLQAKGYRQAIMENIHRENLSPMDMATDIQLLRGKFKGTATEIAKKIAQYLAVSPATVTQYEKLLKLEADIQAQIHEGTISRDAAFVLAGVSKDKRKEVLAQAETLQKAEAEPKQEPTESEPSTEQTIKGKSKPRETGTVKARHVRAAARSVEGATDKPQPRTKKDILEFFDALEGPISGYADGLPHLFIKTFRSWCAGIGSDKKLEKSWLELIERAPKGHSAKEPEKPKADKKK